MALPLSKDIGKPMPPDQAKKWIRNFQEQNPGAMKACFFGADILEKILRQDSCIGIRVYNAIDDKGSAAFVIVGAKENGNNIWPSNSGESSPDGIIGEYGGYCPPMCVDNE